MFDLTDNQFYLPQNVQCWKILRPIDLQKMPILAKKIIFSDEALDLGGYVNKKNFRIWSTENMRTELRDCIYFQYKMQQNYHRPDVRKRHRNAALYLQLAWQIYRAGTRDQR